MTQRCFLCQSPLQTQHIHNNSSSNELTIVIILYLSSIRVHNDLLEKLYAHKKTLYVPGTKYDALKFNPRF
jgi:hypothetical protein